MTTSTQEKAAIEAGLDLNRSDWELVSFGDVAKKQNASEDRENTDLTRYVAGEHMGSEDLHLRLWGEIGEDYLGPAFTRRFEKGDILYGSRRTYLRKVAVAHFDGITANTTFVIKPNKKLILPELLPFVLLSEGFAQHSIRNSKGSVNPYVNWKDIANYEFLLPPKDQQAKLAELLWAADAAVERSSKLRDSAAKLQRSIYADSAENSKIPVLEGRNHPMASNRERSQQVYHGIERPHHSGCDQREKGQNKASQFDPCRDDRPRQNAGERRDAPNRCCN